MNTLVRLYANFLMHLQLQKVNWL